MDQDAIKKVYRTRDCSGCLVDLFEDKHSSEDGGLPFKASVSAFMGMSWRELFDFPLLYSRKKCYARH